MGFADKLKDLQKQARDAVAEHREQIHDAVDVAGAVADRKTRGRHTARIAKLGDKAGQAIDRFGAERGAENAAPVAGDAGPVAADSRPVAEDAGPVADEAPAPKPSQQVPE